MTPSGVPGSPECSSDLIRETSQVKPYIHTQLNHECVLCGLAPFRFLLHNSLSVRGGPPTMVRDYHLIHAVIAIVACSCMHKNRTPSLHLMNQVASHLPH